MRGSNHFTRFQSWVSISLLACIIWPSLLFANAFEERDNFEKKLMGAGSFILAHRPTYILPFTYDADPNEGVYDDIAEADLDNAEVKFQFSFKTLLAKSLFKDRSQLFFAYTQLSFWQLYNKDVSSPFRDTNYEPEFFVNFKTAKPVGPLVNRGIQVGAVHQSNGRSEPLSRSWNRIYAQFVLDHKDFVVMLKPWYRIPESSDVDNNPDIHRYMGYGELRLAGKWKSHVFSTLIRNNLNFNDNKGALELNWSFPITFSMKGYVQYFNGYGECLLDYNHYNNRIGIGIALIDWL